MSQLLAYVAGPYRHATEHGIRENIRRAREVALELWASGFAVICPHSNTEGWGGARGLPDETWLTGDITMLRRCDLLVVCPGWQRSEGTRAEISEARNCDIPIFYWETDKEHLTKAR